ncbi:TPA: ferredoxin family protein [Citrobacter braakii]|jgi:ferredoxin-like protein FixX|uniref:ferredoxin family protein n=1 Tax=Citrobacter TaxID=544 RepID=UPI0010401D3F|nr:MULTISPECIES: ferredoxin family protein [Citrobacter]EMC3651578.1 ferredoxin family protein [Citrobacter braakii]KAA0555607.1 ferredoxin family protein [Citrobacter braakii]MDK2366494.1 ferredoxin family protein [Citrobacter braakii]MDM3350929.1 ferredoxin family protein [Citrobacter sp. Cb007]MDM3399542.1 ferredoxin family protein [Citrobacter sp. Cb016]
MSVARNVWRPADISHIVPATVIDSETAQRLIASCPAGLFSLTAEGELRVNFRGCLECGTCRLLCDEKTLQQWRYPASGFGITYRFG